MCDREELKMETVTDEMVMTTTTEKRNISTEVRFMEN